MTMLPSVGPQMPISLPGVTPRGDRDPFARDDVPRFDDVLSAMLGDGAASVLPGDDPAATMPVRTVAEMFNEDGFFHGVRGDPAEPVPESGGTPVRTDFGGPPTILRVSSVTPSAGTIATEPAMNVGASHLPATPAQKEASHSAPPPVGASSIDANVPAGITRGSTSTVRPFRASIAALLRRLPFGATPRPNGPYLHYPIAPGGGHMADVDGGAGVEHCGTPPRVSGPKILPKIAEQTAAQVVLHETSQGVGIVAQLDQPVPDGRARLRDRIAAVLARHGYAIDFVRLAAPRSASPDHRLEG